ncbi:uncharacterized protein N7498_002709 [Penicillium cinerascens]|uniref:Rhodopsin domain-containing protein n=1 Tax=Penicillium cinerascens TaxID=70096 RepID=A0A9W9TB56_9EURO|nr:uncharacterized protein N7498_002709 [Penicillium cinerascens]KAJ5216302.1 hypothetical protein N7498_002709 [Penicillium cinerascens]
MGPYVPPGQSPPFEVVDEYHHGAWIIISAALGLVVTLVCFLIRLYVRLMLIPPFARDDYVLLGATIMAIVQASLIFYACSRGFGTSIIFLDDTRLNQIQALIAISDIFALVIIYLSKCCVVTIYLRLTPQKPHNRASWATLALCTAWLIPAIFILLVNCELNKPWRSQGGQCLNLFKRWQFIAAVDVITELIIFFLAVILLKGLFMSMKRKLAIGFAFIFRFPLIIFTLLHISSLHSALSETDVTLAAVEPTLWLQVEVHYALVACSVFCLRPFMAAVSTNYGTAGDSNLESSASASRSKSSKSGSGSGSGNGSRSRSLCRAQRKRAGTESNTRGLRSASKEELCDGNVQDGMGREWKKQVKNTREEARAPIRRSMFAISEPSMKNFSRLDKGKDGRGSGSGSGSGSGPGLDGDAIELIPQTHRDSRGASDGPESGPDPMVIRKEVQYSVQYEYDEARRRGQGPSKRVSNDAMAYV